MSNQQKRLIYMQCKTIQIKSAEGFCLTINKDDYDQKVHVLWSEDKPKKQPVKRSK